ncbi:pyruvate kinase [uncultured Oscillibacter sp.]|uniref:pyruvate kinase n=1 Tax=uncultured Oscillibacter sp. TaxID=876091 RepID=UPI00261BDBA4|nr:pyruvate kinase [uncultured Oscillibacter sp.]
MVQIYGTLGPACDDTETLARLFEAGMTGVRLNLSHIGLPGAAEQIELLHAAARRLGVTPQLLIDMQGPELRVGALPSPLELADGALVRLGADVPLPPAVLPHLLPGQEVLLDDGKLLLRVAEAVPGGALARVERGGTLLSRKSAALPGVDIRLPAMTDSDRENLRLAREYGVTGVMQPFVRGREDLETVREALDDSGGRDIRLFAKVESLEGVERLAELIPAAGEIVIARGDLGNAGPLWKLPALQKRVAAACREAGRPFMVVTQMLASMERCAVPTRAEVSDVFNAVLDGASSVMLTGETAVGKHPVEAMRYFANTVREAERYLEGQ